MATKAEGLRRAALNMMEDAVIARRQAEEAFRSTMARWSPARDDDRVIDAECGGMHHGKEVTCELAKAGQLELLAS